MLAEIEHLRRQGVHEGTETDPISCILPAHHHLQRARGRGRATPFEGQPGPVRHLEAKAVAERGRCCPSNE